MKLTELWRLVWINLAQNKFKVILTSLGIVVGTATIMMVIAIGTGGKKEVAEQFKNLNAGAIDISYETSERSSGELAMGGGRYSAGTMSTMTVTVAPSGGIGGGMPGGGFMLEGGADARINQENVSLTETDREDLSVFVPELSDSTISFSTQASVDGGDLEESATYTIAGVKSNYATLSNMELVIGEFLTEENEENKEKVCVLGSNAAKAIFGSAYEAYDGTVYIDDRPYTVSGVIEEMGTVASGISPDEAIFIPYATGVKYITGDNVSPTIMVIAEDVNHVETVTSNIEAVLLDSYPNSEFTIADAGSKMDAAMASNDTLTMLLIAMALIVFLVGGIGIMNVLFVSVKERTNEIGILKALGITPVIESFSVRVELSVAGAVVSLLFGIVTGSLFGFYPAYKASKLIPVEALNQE